MSFSTKQVNAHLRRGEYKEADRLCQEAIKTDPGNGDLWHIRGMAAIGAQAFDRATQYILRAIFHKPGSSAMHLNLGIALGALERTSEARLAFEEAVKLEPSSLDMQLALASFYLTQKEYEKAQGTIDAALALRPESAQALDLDALVAQRLAQFDRAFASAAKALQIDPNLPNSHRVTADLLMRGQDYAAAQDHYEAALKLRPKDWEARSNYGLLLSRTARYAEAVEHYQAALPHLDKDAQSHFSYSVVLLALGRLEEGWPLYAARAYAYAEAPPAHLAHLDRLPAPGDRVLLTTDQGPGEQIMFASLLPDLVRTGAELTVTCDERLVPLFQRSFPTIRIIRRRDPLPSDLTGQIGLADTARWLRPTFASFPPQDGYIVPDPPLTASLRTRYSAGRKKQLVGISWNTVKGAKISGQKSIPLDQWGPILSMPDATFVSLQYGETAEAVRGAEASFGVRIVQDPEIDPLRNLDAFASQVAAMDLVITTSNTTAHVAGALNVPTYVFVPQGYGGLWHWFLDRTDSPWYPSVRLLRQRETGVWQDAIDEASALLAGFIEARTRPAT